MLRIETLELLDIFFTSNFERSCNLDAKTTKNLPRQKLKGQDKLLFKKSENFRGFRVFDFVLHPKTKTRKSRKVFFYSKFLEQLQFKIQKRQKSTDTKT